jgi:serine protease Do
MNFPTAGLTDELAGVAERLRRSAVEVRREREGIGSGVIWDASGLIVTNAHVASGPDLRVALWDGSRLPARVVARDPDRDLAALVVPAGNLPAVSVRDSNSLRAGELAIAVGNPWGFTGAVAVGIIHAVGAHPVAPATLAMRKISRINDLEWVLADVRLAPGNSGGPLADARGRLVGINSMIVGGLALAVPSQDISRFLKQSRMDWGEAA